MSDMSQDVVLSVPARLMRISLFLLTIVIGGKSIDDANLVFIMQALIDCFEKITEEEFIALDQAGSFRFLEECKVCLSSEGHNSIEDLVERLKQNLIKLTIPDCVNRPC